MIFCYPFFINTTIGRTGSLIYFLANQKTNIILLSLCNKKCIDFRLFFSYYFDNVKLFLGYILQINRLANIYNS